MAGPVGAVSQLAAAGNEVLLEKAGGWIINRANKKRIRLHRKGGVYIWKMWVPADNEEASGFTRQGS